MPYVLQFVVLRVMADAIEHLRQRWKWHTVWAVLLIVAFCGLLNMTDMAGWLVSWQKDMNAPSLGGLLGKTFYRLRDFWMFGARHWRDIIVYSLCVSSACCS